MSVPTVEPKGAPVLGPPVTQTGVLGWLRANLFSTWYNAILTLLGLYFLYSLIPPLIDWAFVRADWSGDTREACDRDGACWVYIKVWFWQLVFGRYPIDERWRVVTAFIILGAAIAPLLIPSFKWKRGVAVFLLVIYPIIAYFLFVGDAFSLPLVETPLWGGLFLTLVIALVGIVASLPIGILLALGRRSNMVVVRAVCVAFIEVWRGVPLITVLFMASVMFPLFMPEGVNVDKLIRALIGVMLFSAAYLAEVVRGGLQAIPRGQYEAAQAIGLSYWRMMGLIVLPQALRLVIPGIVNSFIALFKDTTLVLIIGLFDLLGMVQSVGTNPHWLGFAVEGYVFTAFVFWIFTFSMSRYSMSLEKRLHTGYQS
jgi:general L-amino acid transport system permease protein